MQRPKVLTLKTFEHTYSSKWTQTLNLIPNSARYRTLSNSLLPSTFCRAKSFEFKCRYCYQTALVSSSASPEFECRENFDCSSNSGGRGGVQNSPGTFVLVCISNLTTSQTSPTTFSGNLFTTSFPWLFYWKSSYCSTESIICLQIWQGTTIWPNAPWRKRLYALGGELFTSRLYTTLIF